ncbi:FAD-binding oxidoreductase [Aspergillus lucknowensis]|uniref:FAD-binding PCMH-type domain-containing protein n=1 Tax=Aspergillus lucknowensis TaxID=176173 RepID=A0ABR4LKV6_9EURO
MGSIAEQAFANLRTAGLGDVLYLPGQEAYDARVASYWSLTAQLRPWAIVQPRNTEEVSKAVKAIVGAPDCKFAVRSGGHTPWMGASNIVDGVTIDLGLMAGVAYNPETEIASLLPGGTWANAYTDLEKQGRMVAGGREGKVGIAGLVTGGGKTFYTCRVGFACDQVANYEVVLADGSIVNANDQTNPDLFRALKGGGNNFGIVTRFDMVTFPATNIWDCTMICPKESTPQLAEAFLDFVKNVTASPNNHVLGMWTYLPRTVDHFVLLSLMNLDCEEEPHTLSKFLALPGKKDAKVTTIATKLKSFIVPSGNEDTWFTLTFKADLRIILKAAAVFEALIQTMKTQIPDGNFHFSMVLQPLPPSFGKHSAARGGNMLGLDRIDDDCVLLVWGVLVDTAEVSTTIGFPALKGAIDEIESYAKSLGGDVGFRYLNYCDGSQDPLGSYGAENIRKMREAAAKFDPEGVFQTRVPGGFKISKVRARDE